MFSQLPSNSKIGIIGSGQLGLMMVLEGIKLGFNFNVLGKTSDYVCRFAKCYGDNEIKQFLDDSEIVTFEFEQGNENAMIEASDKSKLYPNYKSVWLKIEKDREKKFYSSYGFPVPSYKIAESGADALKVAKDEFNGNAVIKRTSGGYDGKGQFYVRNNKITDNIENLRERMVVEELVEFDYESSVIITRDRSKIVSYPVSFNYNREGILIFNYGSIKDNGETEIARSIAEKLDYIGTMGVEFFIKNGKPLVNEFSPRVHNSGHYTLNSSFTSQFENHIRAISGIGLGQTSTIDFFGMVNILGKSGIKSNILNLGNVYWYGKDNTSPRRKVGHINVTGSTQEDIKKKIDLLLNELYDNDFNFLKYR